MKNTSVALLSALFFSYSYASAPDEFSPSDLVFLLIVFTSVISVELLIARMFAAHRKIHNLFLAVFALVNIFSLNLVLNTSFLALPMYLKVFALMAALFILYTLMNMMDEFSRVGRLAPLLMLVAIVGVTTTTIYAGRLHDWPIPEQGKTHAKNINLVEFHIKPNVYFVSFDALLPKSILAKYLEIETAPYHVPLDANFLRLSNFFADRIWTANSLNSLLALDLDYFDGISDRHARRRLFSGLTPSPLLEIFKHNGYNTNTLHYGAYFGRQKGPYVDNYLYAQKFRICDFVEARRSYTYLGYCAILDALHGNYYIQRVQHHLGFDLFPKVDYSEYFLEKVKAGLKQNNPQFFLAYISSPGHATQPRTFDYTDSRDVDNFLQKKISYNGKIAAKYIENIVTFIQANDPEAILYLFGDHGAFLSFSPSVSGDRVFVIQDRFGVYGGIYPKDACVESLSNPYTKNFVTVSQGARMIVRCLAGGSEPFSNPRDYLISSLDASGSLEESHQQYYEDFLYE